MLYSSTNYILTPQLLPVFTPCCLGPLCYIVKQNFQLTPLSSHVITPAVKSPISQSNTSVHVITLADKAQVLYFSTKATFIACNHSC